MSVPIQSFKVSLDRQEQYYGRNCWLIYGLPENTNENIDQFVIETLKEKIGEKIKKVDLDRTHRLGAPQNDDQEDEEEHASRLNFIMSGHTTEKSCTTM